MDVAAALFGPARAALLATLFRTTQRTFHLRELIRVTGLASGTVQRELASLVRVGLVKRTPSGRSVVFAANRQSTIEPWLRGLITATVRRTRGSGSLPAVPVIRQPRETRTDSDVPQIGAEAFERHRLFIGIAINRMMLAHLGTVYRSFDGDLVRAIVLGETTHHNVEGLLQACDHDERRFRDAIGGPAGLARIPPSNAFSISQATGIPRETVRRKVRKLVKAGLLVRQPNGDLFVVLTPGAYTRFDADTRSVANALLDTASRITGRLKRSDPQG